MSFFTSIHSLFVIAALKFDYVIFINSIYKKYSTPSNVYGLYGDVFIHHKIYKCNTIDSSNKNYINGMTKKLRLIF